jgi:serine/threonine protein kinase
MTEFSDDLVNRLIAEIDDHDMAQDPNSVRRYLSEHQISESVAEAVIQHFANAAALQGNSSRARSPASSPNLSSVGPYRLIKKLGEGGMGSVWLARQEEPIRRQVALKLVRAGLDSEQFLRRFETERQAQALMDHPHVAKVLDAGTTDQNSPYFVMEYLPGDGLIRYCNKKQLNTRARLKLFLDLCDAIQHAHQKGVVHRDIKPSNVIVCEIDGRPVVKVIDFGLARAIDAQELQLQTMTQFGTVLGSLPYMSPEQARGSRGKHSAEDIDTRTDVYSLGAVLFELLTGTTPIRIETIREIGVVETLRRIQEQEPPRPSVRVQELLGEQSDAATVSGQQNMRQLVGDLDWIVVKALEIDRDRRYDTVSELSRDVDCFLDDEPVSARPPSRVYLMQKFVRKHRIAVISSAMIVAALAIGLVLAAWQANRARIANNSLETTNKELEKTNVDLAAVNKELKQTNADLDSANQIERKLRRDQIVEQIGYLVSRGQWKKAQIEIGKLEAVEPGQLPEPVLLAKLAVADGLQQTEELRAMLREYQTQEWADRWVAERNVWQAYVSLLDGNAKVDPKELLQSALKTGTLVEADKYFSRGLLSKSLPESTELYRQALEESSFHLRARLQLVITLILLGRRDEAARETASAIEYFPDDLRFYHAQGLNAAFGADRPTTLSAIEVANARFPEVKTGYILTALEIAEEFDKTLTGFDSGSQVSLLKLVAKVQAMSLSQKTLPVREFHKPQIFEAFFPFVRTLTNPIYLISSEENRIKLMGQACQRSYQIHPDALFLLMEGIALYAAGQNAEAETIMCKAMDGFSFSPAVAREAKFFAFAARAGIFVQTKNEEDLEIAVDYLVDYPVSRITPMRFELVFNAFARTGHWKRAKEAIEVMIRQNGDRKGLMKKMAKQAEKYEDYGIALQTWDELLLAFPDDSELVDLRAALIKRMAEKTGVISSSTGE